MTGKYVKLEFSDGKQRTSIWERKNDGIHQWALVSGADSAYDLYSVSFFKALDKLYEKYITEMVLLDQA